MSALPSKTAHPPQFERDSPHAWRIVAAGFFSCFILFGVAYSFGAFFKPMAAQFGANREATSAIFSITAFIYFMLGAVTGHLADRFGPRPIVSGGAIIMGIGLVLTAFIDRLWLGYLTYGIGVGAGVACCYVPLVASISGWFLRRRNTALGVAVSGIGAGTLAIAPLAGELIDHFGWRHAYIIMGVASTICLLACASLAERAPVELDSASPPLGHSLRRPDFFVLYASSILWSVATSVPFVFLPVFAREQGFTEVASAALIGFIGFGSLAGRLGLGTLADRMTTIRIYRFAVLALGLSFSIWLLAHSYGTLIVFALVMGASYGGAVTLSPAVIAELFGTQKLGVILGALWTSSAFGTLLGPPLAGAIVDHTGSYRIAIGFTMAATIAAFLILLRLGTFGASESTVAQAD